MIFGTFFGTIKKFFNLGCAPARLFFLPMYPDEKMFQRDACPAKEGHFRFMLSPFKRPILDALEDDTDG